MMKKVFFKQRNLEIGECNGIKLESCRNLFQAGKDFCPNSGDEKNEIMKFLGFSKIGIDFSLQIYFSKKKKIFENIFLKNFFSRFWKPQKFHDFVFSFPEFERSCFGREFVEIVFFSSPKVCREKVFLITFISSRNEITPSKTFPSIPSQTSPNPIPDQSQSHQSLPLKTKIQFDQNFLPAKQSANYSMFFRRL